MKKPAAKLTALERARQARAQAYVQAAIREAHARGRHIVFGAPIDLHALTPKKETSNMRTPVRLATDSNAPKRYPLPPDLPKAIAAIKKALVLPDDADANTIATALAALLEAYASDPTRPENIEAAGHRLGLSRREIDTIVELNGDPVKYAARKAEQARLKSEAAKWKAGSR